jgi:hypothetical protein
MRWPGATPGGGEDGSDGALPPCGVVRNGFSGGMRPAGDGETAPDTETTPLVALAEKAERDTGDIMCSSLGRMAE